jgi:hypothetical protein
MYEARYLYCIADDNKEKIFGKIGIENSRVYTIPYKDLCAVVHNCPSEPYESEDKEKVKSWVITHEKVIEAAWAGFGTVLPSGFDTIIRGDHHKNAEDNLKQWLKEDYINLRQKLDKLRSKTEFGVQIFWDPKTVGKSISAENKEIKKLKKEIQSKSKGLAYMYKQRLENLLRKQMEKEAEKYFKDFYERINRYADEIKVEKTKKSEEEREMLMNLSCLLPEGKKRVLGEVLEKINNMEEFFVRFTGPWPPYSFV